MMDGLGTVSYQYNQLSQMTAETRQFIDNLPGAPLPNNSYSIQYGYGLNGQLTSLTEPFGVAVNYNHDKIGRLASVTLPTAYGNTSTLATNAQYRAFGALKNLEYGNGLQMNQTFNNKLQAASYQLADTQQQVMNKTYDYYADGSLRYVQDLLNPKFDRLNSYDHLGRIKEAKSSAEARGQTIPAYDYGTQLPYRQSFQFNAFGDMTARANVHWGNSNQNTSYTITNHWVTSVPFVTISCEIQARFVVSNGY